MGIRQAKTADFDQVIVIIDMARAKLQERGIPQWQNGDGPSEEIIRQDISRGECYILERDAESLQEQHLESLVVGTAALTVVPEPGYETITDGEWQGNAPCYISIHRVAIDPRQHGKGYAKELLRGLLQRAVEAGFADIRIDTHPHNFVMQRTLAAVGFVKRGSIMLDVPDGERVAYQYGHCNHME